jgi:hypothetical protein
VSDGWTTMTVEDGRCKLAEYISDEASLAAAIGTA